MAFVYLQSQIAFNAAGQFCEVVNYWGIDTPTETNSFRLARILVNSMQTPSFGGPYLTKLVGILSEDTFISSIKARVVTPGGGANFINVFAAADFPGVFDGELVAQQIAGYVKWMTAGDDGQHGGNFYPGVSSEALDANRFTDDYKAAMSTFIAGHCDGILATTGLFRPMLARGVSTGGGYLRIVCGQISTTAGTQRRRLTPV